jgi:dCMP deaminase
MNMNMNMKVTVNPNRIDLDEAYMQMAEVWAKRSKANRQQVGALIVKDRQIISDGYNGMPAGTVDDVCEEVVEGGELRTKREVMHAESNALLKITENGGGGARGATLYITLSPCFDCAKLMLQAKIKRVVFRDAYRDMSGVQFLYDGGVEVQQLVAPSTQSAPIQVAPPVVAPATVTRQPLSMFRQISSAGEVERLRAQGPLTTPVPTPVPTQTALPEVIIGQTEFQPAVSEDEVMAVLRAHEAAVQQQTVVDRKNTPEAPTDGPYHSSFL